MTKMLFATRDVQRRLLILRYFCLIMLVADFELLLSTFMVPQGMGCLEILYGQCHTCRIMHQHASSFSSLVVPLVCWFCVFLCYYVGCWFCAVFALCGPRSSRRLKSDMRLANAEARAMGTMRVKQEFLAFTMTWQLVCDESTARNIGNFHKKTRVYRNHSRYMTNPRPEILEVPTQIQVHLGTTANMWRILLSSLIVLCCILGPSPPLVRTPWLSQLTLDTLLIPGISAQHSGSLSVL